MIKRYDIKALPQTFRNELEQFGENFRVLYGENYVDVEFFDIRELKQNGYDENKNAIDEIVIYEKRHKEEVEIDGEVKSVDVYEPYDFDINLLESIVNNHDPNALPNPNLTLEERIDRLELLTLQANEVI